MADFIDNEALQALAEKARDALTALGLTPTQQQVVIDPDTGDPILVIASLVRKTAHDQITGDLEVRKQVERMAAEEHARRLNERVAAYTRAIEEGRIMDVLTGQAGLVDCAHEDQDGVSTLHEGLCLLCHEEVTDGKTE